MKNTAFKLIIVNYHYIRETAAVRGIYNITPEAFSRQIESIHAAGFHFVSLDDLHTAIREGDCQRLGQKACLITFDDGLRESYELGLSILDSKGIPGAFYVCAATLGKESVLDVHKFHYIQSELSSHDIVNHLSPHLRSRVGKVADAVVKAQYVWDDFSTAKLKYLINFLLNPEERQAVVQSMFDQCVSSESVFAEKLYMTHAQIQDLAKRDFLGGHGNMHIPLAGLSAEALRQEIANSKSALDKVSGGCAESISYPYGGETAISEDVFCESRRQGFVSGMSMIRGLNTEHDLINGGMRLKRFDTNDVYGGKSEAIYRGCFND